MSNYKRIRHLGLVSCTVGLLASTACMPQGSEPLRGAVVQNVSQSRTSERGRATIRIKLAPRQAQSFGAKVIPMTTERIQIHLRQNGNPVKNSQGNDIPDLDNISVTEAMRNAGEVTASFSDLPVDQAISLQIQAFETYGAVERLVAEKTGSITVKPISQAGGGRDSQRFELERVNPVSNLNPNAPVCEDCPEAVINLSTRNYVFKLSDPNADQVRMRVNWGDDSSEEASDYVMSNGQVTLPHNYENTGDYTITAVAYDVYGQVSTPLTHNVNVTPALGERPDAPTCASCPGVGQSNNAAHFQFNVGSVAENQYKVTVDWGDGTTPHPESNTITGTGIVQISHTYATPGTYTINVAAWDQFNTRSENVLEHSINISSGMDPEGTYTHPKGMTFVSIPGGSFMMGSPDGEGNSNERPQHSVTLSGFQMMTTEVTQKQWYIVMDGWSPAPEPITSYGKGDNYPMYYVSWCDIVGASGDPVNCSSVPVGRSFLDKLNATGTGTYRLPTEAEWEYAARASTTTQYACGGYVSFDGGANANSCPYKMGWFWENNEYNGKASGTKEVGHKQPNAWGLYDMHGNVWEWVHDWYEPYSSAVQTNPTGPTSPTAGYMRVGRGGAWDYGVSSHAHSAYRGGGYPTDGFYYNFGFRVVRLP